MPAPEFTAHFAPKFFRRLDAQGPDKAAPGAPAPAAAVAPGAPRVYFSRQKYGNFENFMRQPEFGQCQAEFAEACKTLREKADRLPPRLRTAARNNVGRLLDTIHGRGDRHLAEHVKNLFDDGKRALETILAQLDNPAVSEAVKQQVLEDVCARLDVCAEGVTSYLQLGAQTLMLDGLGQAGDLHKAKTDLLEGCVMEFIHTRHPELSEGNPYAIGNEVHIRNCYRNHLCASLGLEARPDAYADSFLRGGAIDQEDLHDFSGFALERITPAHVARAIAETHLDECEAIVGRHQPGRREIAGEDYQGALQHELDDKARALQQDYSARMEDVVAYDYHEDGSETYQVQRDSNLLAASVLQEMRRAGFVEGNPSTIATCPVTPGAAAADAGSVKAIGDIAWVETGQGARTPLDINHPAVPRINVAEYPSVVARLLRSASAEDILRVFPDASLLVQHDVVVEALARRLSPAQLDSYLGAVRPEPEPARRPLLQRFRRALNRFVLTRLFRVSPGAGGAVLRHANIGVVNEQDRRTGDSLLHQAVRRGDLARAEQLLKRGIDRSLVNKDGLTAFGLALGTRHVPYFAAHLATPEQALAYLSRRDLLPGTKNRFIKALLMRAPNPEIVRTLAAAGRLDVNQPMPAPGGTNPPLALALRNSNPAVFHSMVELGADPAARDRRGKTLLHYVSRDTAPSITRALIKAGIDVNARDADGVTPLHVAAARGDIRLARALLKAGADKTMKSDKYGLPMHAAWNAVRNNDATREEMVRLLHVKGA